MTLNDLVFHPAQLVKVDLVSLECHKSENYESQDQEQGKEINIVVNLEISDIEESRGKTEVTMNLIGKEFDFSIVQCGTFCFDLDADDAVLKTFLKAQSVKLMWPYFREVVYDFSGRMLSSPIVIPTLDVLATLKKTSDTEE